MATLLNVLLFGSPPRVRGKLRALVAQAYPIGITPARAGKTEKNATFACFLKDHPRACGENDASRDIYDCVRGSPPRVRGKLLCRPVHAVVHGITPARAGKTF